MTASGARVGLGIDLHRFDPRRPLRLGGVVFAGEPGLAGHSDGDAVCHAVADAVLGACGLGDVGAHFPDTDPGYAGVDGLELLSRTLHLARAAGYVPSQVDLTVLADRPAIAPRREEMRVKLAAALRIETTAVSVKATRPEGLGLTGDGVGCLAVVVVEPTASVAVEG